MRVIIADTGPLIHLMEAQALPLDVQSPIDWERIALA